VQVQHLARPALGQPARVLPVVGRRGGVRDAAEREAQTLGFGFDPFREERL